MKLRASVLCMSLLFAVADNAMAIAEKTNSPYDHRIKTVAYNPMDTVQIDGVVGNAVTIVVGQDEEYVSHVFGMTDGWTLAHTGNNYFLRPKAEMSDTNLTIITNKRTYFFLLHYVGDNNGKFINTPWSMKAATVAVIFTYPFEDGAKAQKRIEAAAIQQKLRDKAAAAPKNLDYLMSTGKGTSAAIKPVNVWDDGQFTYFKFAANGVIPTLFVIGPDGKESVVNTHIEGDNNNVIVAHSVAQAWRIRYGQKVIGVVNQRLDQSVGATTTGTASDSVRRVRLLEDEQ